MSTPRATIIATQKNEGLFLVEWIAHHLGVGFDAIVLATNDCEDGSVALIQCHCPTFPSATHRKFSKIARNDDPVQRHNPVP
jgi:hypothetical protein